MGELTKVMNMILDVSDDPYQPIEEVEFYNNNCGRVDSIDVILRVTLRGDPYQSRHKT